MKNIERLISHRLMESMAVHEKLLQDAVKRQIGQIAAKMADTIQSGGKLLICGNGGSASDALHFAGELVGRFQKERNAWPAIALNADVSTMTAIANDYGYQEIFARQVKALAKQGDILVGISTSGNSENVLRAVDTAKEMGICTICLLGKNGGKLAKAAQMSLVVPESVTARVQEAHITIIHVLCEIIEEG